MSKSNTDYQEPGSNSIPPTRTYARFAPTSERNLPKVGLPGFSETTFEHEGVEHPVFRKGEGPGVVLMHDITGVSPEVRLFAEQIADAGFTVFVPQLFGTPNKSISPLYATQIVGHMCISREFTIFRSRRSSPVTQWLRALCRSVHAELGGKGVGAIGMCLTGNFALSLMADKSVMAPVLSQPSLPISITPAGKRGLHISDEELDAAKQRVAEGACVLGFRFTHDPLCPPERFERLRDELGDGFEGIEIDSSPGNPHGHPRMAHAVLTRHLIDEEGQPTRQALERLMTFLDERLN